MNSEKFSSPPPPLPIEQLQALRLATDFQQLPIPQPLEALVAATPPVPMSLAQISASSVAPPVPVLPEELPATIPATSSTDLPYPKSLEQLVAETNVDPPIPMSFQELSQISRS